MGIFGPSNSDIFRQNQLILLGIGELHDDIHQLLHEAKQDKVRDMTTQAEVNAAAAKNQAGLATITTYLQALKAQLEAANEAANVDLSGLIGSVDAVAAFADGLNPATPAPETEPPTEVPSVPEAEGEAIPVEPAPVEEITVEG